MAIELTRERSQQVADQIEIIKIHLHLIDSDYCKAVAKAMHQQANNQDSMAVLNPSYNPDKSTLIHKQAKMLDKLIEFMELGKECDQLKLDIKKNDESFQNIKRMFL